MSNRRLFVLLALLAAVAVMIFLLVSDSRSAPLAPPEGSSSDNQVKQTVRVAACPTYQALASASLGSGFAVTPVGSTAAALSLLRSGEVDLVISGRPPKPDESGFAVEYVAQDGFSFLSANPATIRSGSLTGLPVCTDLSMDDIKRALGLNNVTAVADVYGDCGPETIVLTSWDNTDYSRAYPLHVLNDDSTRLAASRTPIIYRLAGEHGQAADSAAELLREGRDQQ